MYSLSNCHLGTKESKMFNRKEMRFLKKDRKNSQENCIFWAQKIEEWSIIANSKNFFSFRNKVKTKIGAAMQKELVKINDLFQFGSKNFRQHLIWGGWLLEKEKMAVK